MKKYIFLCVAMLLFMITGCSHDNNSDELTSRVRFGFTNEDFGEDEVLTRTGAVAKEPQTINIGDCEAEITVENEPVIKKTRGAQTNANGHYTIRAYQGSSLKDEMSGTFSGGTFTPDVSSKARLQLPHGTYELVAFNDDVTTSGNNLVVSRDKAATAMMGTQTVNITDDNDLYVQFTMKHVGCRLRTQFVCQKHIPNNITATLEAVAANVIPTSVTYDPTTKAYTGNPGTIASEANNSAASTEAKFDASYYGLRYSYTSTSDYHYFLPTTAGSKLKLTGISAGTVFWKPIPTFNIAQLNATLQMQPNKSYVVKIKLTPSYSYLMSDGSVGHFKDTTFGGGSKTPIAIVIDADHFMAMALNALTLLGGSKSWCDYGWPHYYYNQTNTHMATVNDALGSQATSGLEETWNPAYSTNLIGSAGETKVKGNNPRFRAIYAAAHYDPGVTYTGTPALVWYLPSLSDFRKCNTLGFEETVSYTGPMGQTFYSTYCYGYLLAKAFQKVGGDNPLRQFWTSTETDPSYAGTYYFSDHQMNPGSADKGSNVKRDILSFVKYK